MQYNPQVWPPVAPHKIFMVLALSLGVCAGACYSALDPANESSSQYAGDSNGDVTGSVFVPIPERAWSGFNLVPQNANTMCVDAVLQSGTGVYLQQCTGGVLQAFKWEEGTLSIAGNRCLDLDSSGGQPGAGSAVVLSPCDPNATSQLWTFANNSNGFIHPEVIGRIGTSAPSSLCLSTLNQSSDVGSTLQLVDCNQSVAPTLWDLALFDGNTKSWGGFPISSAAGSHYCFDDPDGVTAANTLLQVYDCIGGMPQQYSMRGGLLTVDGVCVDVINNDPNERAPVGLNPCDSALFRQQFVLEHGRLHARQGINVGHCIEDPNNPPAASDPLGFTSCTADSNLTSAPGMHWVFGFDRR